MVGGRRSLTVMIALAGAAGLTAVAWSSGAIAGARTAGAPRAASLAGSWRTAREIPGVAALNKGGYAQVTSVSCARPGNCSAGGYYTERPGITQAFVVSEVKGTWHKAIEVPGIAALNKARSQVNSVSCASAGNCSAGGFYVSTKGNQAFVVNEVKDVWHKAAEIPGTAALNKGGYAGLTSVSCRKPGNCTAGGYYDGNSTSYQGFVASEVNGRWRRAIRVPGIVSSPANGHVGPTAQVNSVSCGSAGNCGIGGFYYDSSHIQAFVGSQVKGRWRKAVKVPGTGALNKGDAEINAVSCGSAGSCSAGGFYTDGRGYEQLMIVNEVNGAWHNAFEVPGTATLNKGDFAQVTSVSCASAGNCSAGGWYVDNSALDVPLVASELNGTWHNAMPVPGITILTRHIFGTTLSVSCSSAGNCSAGGWYTDSADHVQPFVVSEVNRTWHKAIRVPGITSLNRGNDAVLSSVSCSSAPSCSALGSYTDRANHFQVFAVKKT